MTATVAVEVLTAADAGELLTLQRAAFVSEARIYSDFEIPPLLQELPALVAELAESLALGIRGPRGRLLAAVRVRIEGSVAHLARLVVAPDQQGRGLGTSLLRAAEDAVPGGVREIRLFTGRRSMGNLRLYDRNGYSVMGTDAMFVHLAKPLPKKSG